MALRNGLAACLASLLAGCAITPEASPDFPASAWSTQTSADLGYVLAPGDLLELTVYSAPELSRQARVGPDGRLRLPLIEPILAAGYPPEAVQMRVREAYRSQLRSPNLDLLVTEYSQPQIFVGGAVASPGLIAMPGQIDPLQAIIMAGGKTVAANRSDVFVMRRLPGGELKTAVLDLRAGLQDPALAEWMPLQRFDVVYVPRSAIADQNLFVQQYIRDALPISFSLFYDVSGIGQ